ncbi:MAG: hypothetical protein SFU83_13975 [Meiothermus sp.]|nr:hypothetical protein [Meiothermus sp.]
MKNTFFANTTSAIQGAVMGRRLWALIGLGLLIFLAACSSAPAVGTLQVNITGLPTGVNANVKVTGTGFSQDLTTSTPLSNRTLGSYTVTAANVSSGGLSYTGTVTGNPATVTANTTTTVNVTYAVDPASQGTLQVNITVPGGGNGNVRISGPNGFSRDITATTTLSGLVPGAYTLTAINVPGAGTSADLILAGTVSGASTVEAGKTATATVTYAATTGTIKITVNGLPAGVEADIVVTRADNAFQQILTEAATLSGLAPSNYDVTVRNVRVRGAIVDSVFVSDSSNELSIFAGQVQTAAVTYTQRGGTGTLWIPNNDGVVQGLSAAQLGGAGGAVVPGRSVAQTGSNQVVVFDREGRMYVSNSSANQISIYTPAQLAAGGTLTPARTISGTATGLNFPLAMAFDSRGRLFVTNLADPNNATGDSLVAFSPAQLLAGGSPEPVIRITSGSFFNPGSMAFDDRNGDLWVSNNEGTFLRFENAQLQTSGLKQPFGIMNSPDLNAPAGIAFDREGNLWVANFRGDNLLMFLGGELGDVSVSSPAVTLRSNITLNGFNRPRGLAFDNTGNLWLTHDPGVLARVAAAELIAPGSRTVTPARSFTGLGTFRGAGLAFSPTPSNLPIQNK